MSKLEDEGEKEVKKRMPGPIQESMKDKQINKSSN